MKTHHHYLLAVIIAMILSSATSFAQTVPDEAKKYYNRGQAALEMATSNLDYQDAVLEFKKSIDAAPNWAEPYFAVAQVYEKLENYSDAIDNYKKYLNFSPNGTNAEIARTAIDKLGYKLDKQNEKNKIINLLSKLNRDDPQCKVHWKRTGGSPGGVYVLKKFTLNGDKLQAYIPCYMKDTPSLVNKLILAEQTVPVDFDSKTLKYSYKYYNCPTLPEFNYCGYDVKISAELISTSPIKFSVNEEWKSIKTREVENYTAEWIFTED